MAPKEYSLECSTMSCGACETAIEEALMKLQKVTSVKANRTIGTVVIQTSGCSSCTDCHCCNCSPCTCKVCRCCSCGVGAFIKAISEVGHTATYPKTTRIEESKKRFASSYTNAPASLTQQDILSTLLLGVACFVAGYLTKSTISGM
jgi:cation transport ATPase